MNRINKIAPPIKPLNKANKADSEDDNSSIVQITRSRETCMNTTNIIRVMKAINTLAVNFRFLMLPFVIEVGVFTYRL